MGFGGQRKPLPLDITVDLPILKTGTLAKAEVRGKGLRVGLGWRMGLGLGVGLGLGLLGVATR